MSFSEREFLGSYYEDNVFGFQLELTLKRHNRFIFKGYGHGWFSKRRGIWKVEDENVILIYREKYNKEPDTLKIKRLNTKIDSLGKYKKLITND